MEIQEKNITKWSSQKETYYTYHDEEVGEVKVIITEHFNSKDESTGSVGIKILKDNYCMPDLVNEVYKIHFSEDKK